MHEIIQQIAIMAVPVLMAVTFHEVAHGYVADFFGDHTARDAGRLTLNPLKHLDLFGTAVFFITRIIGWAKPVPINPNNLANPRQNMLWIATAGPAANMLLMVDEKKRVVSGMRTTGKLHLGHFHGVLTNWKVTLFIQSKIKENENKNDDLATYGFLGYPVLQAADIIIYRYRKNVAIMKSIRRCCRKLSKTEIHGPGKLPLQP